MNYGNILSLNFRCRCLLKSNGGKLIETSFAWIEQTRVVMIKIMLGMKYDNNGLIMLNI